jgi:hypothetical protein
MTSHRPVVFGAIAVALAFIFLLAASFLTASGIRWIASLTDAELSLYRGACLLLTVVSLGVAGVLRWRAAERRDDRKDHP